LRGKSVLALHGWTCNVMYKGAALDAIKPWVNRADLFRVSEKCTTVMQFALRALSMVDKAFEVDCRFKAPRGMTPSTMHVAGHVSLSAMWRLLLGEGNQQYLSWFAATREALRKTNNVGRMTDKEEQDCERELANIRRMANCLKYPSPAHGAGGRSCFDLIRSREPCALLAPARLRDHIEAIHEAVILVWEGESLFDALAYYPSKKVVVIEVRDLLAFKVMWINREDFLEDRAAKISHHQFKGIINYIPDCTLLEAWQRFVAKDVDEETILVKNMQAESYSSGNQAKMLVALYKSISAYGEKNAAVLDHYARLVVSREAYTTTMRGFVSVRSNQPLAADMTVKFAQYSLAVQTCAHLCGEHQQ
jgi:hypothetical protein